MVTNNKYVVVLIFHELLLGDKEDYQVTTMTVGCHASNEHRVLRELKQKRGSHGLNLSRTNWLQ
jgi:hypothetical protein